MQSNRLFQKSEEAGIPLSYELYRYLKSFNTPIKNVDDKNYETFKRTYLDKDTLLIRKHHSLNIVGINHYKTDTVNFDYASSHNSYMATAHSIAQELQQAVADFFGYFIYTYVPIHPKKIVICHYPDTFSAYAESMIRYEWTYQRCYEKIGDGYTLPFFTFNPNACIVSGIEKALKAKSIPEQKLFSTHTYKNIKAYSGSGLEKYREICLVGNTLDLVRLQSLRIDPRNTHGIITFRDLIRHIQKTKTARATGTSGSAQEIEHMAIDWKKVESLLPLYGDKTEIPGEVLYSMCVSQCEPSPLLMQTA
jgi:hypothetical protein